MKVVVSSITLNSSSSKKDNISNAFHWVREAHASGANWVVLPELFDYMGPYESFNEISETDSGGLFRDLSALASELPIYLFAGSIHESTDDKAGRSYNTHFVFSPTGEMIHKYRKVHLFQLLDNEGKYKVNEGDGFLPGDQVSHYQVDNWVLQTAVCYDLRFPDYFRIGRKNRRPDVIIVPAAFTHTTGKDHWELLLRSRAIESQCYVIASNQVGRHRDGYESYGHSMIIDPWGRVLANSFDRIGVITCEIDSSVVHSSRARLPLDMNRRTDLKGPL